MTGRPRDAFAGVDGVLNVLKPPGMTSHDVVDFARRLGFPRCGHGGTLDPGAAGVLPICVGRATRIAEYLGAPGKEYRVELTLGVVTSTDDPSGEVKAVSDASTVDGEAVARALERLTGELRQVAPPLSAKKFGGVRSYDIVRSGGVPQRRTVTVRVYGARLVRFEAGSRARAVFDMSCSTGTYVRNICRELGEALGCGGHMSFLLRTRSGPFVLHESLTLEELAALPPDGAARVVTTMSDALGFVRGARIAAGAVARVLNGHAPRSGDVIGTVEPAPVRGAVGGGGEAVIEGVDGVWRLISEEGRLVGIARESGRRNGLPVDLAIVKAFP